MASVSASSLGRSKGRIRKRPVSFGNPALGTYNGAVYTWEGSLTNDEKRPLIEGAWSVDRLVAMVGVPPEQVPEGILNLARSHQSWIKHVRIVIEEAQTEQQQQQQSDEQESSEWMGPKEEGEESLRHVAVSKSVAAMEGAASILASEQAEKSDPPDRRYLVLVELISEEAASMFVDDLHQQPYTSLDETQTCNLYHVIALQGESNVSLMSPFFAPATKPSERGLAILPSATSSGEAHHRDKSDNDDKDQLDAEAAKVAHHADEYNCAVCTCI